MSIAFGPAGNSDSIKASGYRSSADAPFFIASMGLNAYEYQCGNGVTVKEAGARSIGEKAREHGIRLSIHAPYYISMSSLEEEKRRGSVRYLLESAALAKKIGAQRIIFHSGSCAKLSREEATALAVETLRNAVDAFDAEGYTDLILCPETMGKINQLGSLDEVMTLCGVDERILPTIDFGHLNAREQGLFFGEEDYVKVLETMEDALGHWRAMHFHSHFSKIEYTAGGEKRHLTFEDTVYGPDFAPLAAVLAKKGAEPIIICESAGTQSRDALEMKRIFEENLQKI